MLLLLVPTLANAQSTNSEPDLLNKNQLKFSFAPVVYENLQIQHFGKELLESSHWPSFVSAISYHQNFSKGFGLNIGAGLSIIPHSVKYNFSSPLTHPSIQEEKHKLYHIDYVLYMGELPLSVQKTFLINRYAKKPLFFSLEIGAKLNFVIDNPYYFASSIYIADENFVEFFNFELYNIKTYLESYFLKIGLLKFTRSYNTFQYNVVVNYSPRLIGEGLFSFSYLPFESYGKIKQGINYLGIEFTYGFSLKKNRKAKQT